MRLLVRLARWMQHLIVKWQMLCFCDLTMPSREVRMVFQWRATGTQTPAAPLLSSLQTFWEARRHPCWCALRMHLRQQARTPSLRRWPIELRKLLRAAVAEAQAEARDREGRW